jgi:hypothetical protein
MSETLCIEAYRSGEASFGILIGKALVENYHCTVEKMGKLPLLIYS